MSFLLTPPVAFAIFIILGLLFVYTMNGLAPKGSESEAKLKQYASGQDIAPVRISPDYSGFFPFAFLFTLMHVVVLVVATLPQDVLGLPLLYLAAAALVVYILIRR
ncbi:MAG: hypothetical protein IJP33_02280 [Firmicutes bacterium]|nr:hypothetical protein [Bacillota bacterium]